MIIARPKVRPLSRKLILLFILFFTVFLNRGYSQQAYFVDGYHGGIWGHYPVWNTMFMADQLKNNPNWKINLEIEPETWDDAKLKDSAAYHDFQHLFTNDATKDRIEYVNPDYAQSYLFDIEGESIIRQFYYGIKTIKRHFLTAVFPVYSSEEPCFTSALPQILTSFGFKYASLKNPNTCWGGYTSAHGGEIVNWIGPDGTSIIASPRYAVEALQSGSTWQTIAWGNSPAYIRACFAAGIQHPIGMTLQDAGWKNGPMLRGNGVYQPTAYTTWANYFENVAIKQTSDNWHFTQENILVSLVWGSQILQQIAQEVRVSENKLIRAEKIAAMAKMYAHTAYPQNDFDAAWKPLLLSQHHDCWIVPYNGSAGNTWADKVVRWTGATNQIADSLTKLNINELAQGKVSNDSKFVRVYNTLAINRAEPVTIDLPKEWIGKNVAVLSINGQVIPSQMVHDSASNLSQVMFTADVPAVGYNTYQLKLQKTTESKGMSLTIAANGNYRIESDLYTIIIDPKKGGAITGLIAKKIYNKEFVDIKSKLNFNQIRGNFYNNGGFKSSADSAATITIIDNGPERIKLKIDGKIAGNPFTQWLTVNNSQPLIDLELKINWIGNPGIGKFTAPGTFKATNYTKAFYSDKEKLLALFPLNLKDQKVYKNAPFDVLQSQLKNTFFTSWDSIKNNIILNWVDVTDGNNSCGMALLTDHTTNYTHGENFPLGLTLAYSGVGLWGRDYKITKPTDIHYALIPHAGKWDKSGIWTKSEQWNEPMIAQITDRLPTTGSIIGSMLSIKGNGYDVTSINADGNDLTLRVFNAEGDSNPRNIVFNGKAISAELIQLDGQKIKDLVLQKNANGQSFVTIAMPRFGIRTIKLHEVKIDLNKNNTRIN